MKEQPFNSVSRQPCGTEALSQAPIEEIVKAVNELKVGPFLSSMISSLDIELVFLILLGQQKKPVRVITLQIKPHLLYKPNLNDINVTPDRDADFQLFDRVIISRDNYTVPLGMRGTIISILPKVDPNPVRQENINAVDYIFEVLFDSSFERGNQIPGIDEKRVLKVRKSVLINISYGCGKFQNQITRLISVISFNKFWVIFTGRPKVGDSDRNPRQRYDNGNMNVNANANANGENTRVNAKDRRTKQLRETYGSVDESKQPVTNYWLTRNQQQPPSKADNNSKQNSGGLLQQFSKMQLEKGPRSEYRASGVKKGEKKQQNDDSAGVCDSGDMLKKMLGIGNVAPSNNLPSPQSNETQPLSLEAFFGKSPNAHAEEKILPNLEALPKPPAKWHQKQKPKEINEPSVAPQMPMNQPNVMLPPGFNHMMASQMPLMQQSMPQNIRQMTLPYGIPGHIPNLYHPAPNYPLVPHPMLFMPGPMPFTHPSQHVRMNGPPPSNFNQQNAQQFPMPRSPILQSNELGNLNKDPNRNASYNSAFIPLQAARKNTKNKPSGNNNVPPSNPIDSRSDDNPIQNVDGAINTVQDIKDNPKHANKGSPNRRSGPKTDSVEVKKTIEVNILYLQCAPIPLF